MIKLKTNKQVCTKTKLAKDSSVAVCITTELKANFRKHAVILRFSLWSQNILHEIVCLLTVFHLLQGVVREYYSETCIKFKITCN